jgi:DNA-binding CsgD family transcriptional regulator
VTDFTTPPVERPLASDGDDSDAAMRRLPRIVYWLVAMVAVGGTVDLVLDRPTSLFTPHVLFELTLILASLASLVQLALEWRRTSAQLAGSERSLAAARRSLDERRAERDAWRRSAEGALAGLGQAIEQQFDAWGLTPTEAEVALFLLKGLGHKQIAGTTGRSERTVRQHAVVVYHKAGVGGRAELAAFFLQDLMLPRGGEGKE